MAKYNITQLNYITTGTNRSYINMDVCLNYEIVDYVHFLCVETETSAYADSTGQKSNKFQEISVDIATEHGEGSWEKTNYIEKANNTPLSHEENDKHIILNEEQTYFNEDRYAKRDYIRLYLSCCDEVYIEKIKKFNSNREKLNCTFLAEKSVSEKNETTCDQSKIHGLYDIVDVSIKKLGTHSLKNIYIPYTDLHHDVYAPGMNKNPIGFCQANTGSEFDNDTILLTDGTIKTPYYLRTSQLKNRGNSIQSNSYTVQFECNDERTYAYHSLSTGGFDSVDSWNPKINYLGIFRSWILDLPMQSKSSSIGASDIASYDDGIVYATKMMPTKTTLNAQYTTEMLSQNEIANCRTYVEIKSVGGQPYLKYYDDTNYINQNGQIVTNKNLETIRLNAVNSKTESSSNESIRPFQKIEFIHPVSYKTNANHKSNLFSIALSGTGIQSELDSANQTLTGQISNSQTTSVAETKKQKLEIIKFDIKSAIREIAKNVAPANTQLFDVQFSD